jgi:hypothetical protein
MIRLLYQIKVEKQKIQRFARRSGNNNKSNRKIINEAASAESSID